jgi:hypothetical protein
LRHEISHALHLFFRNGFYAGLDRCQARMKCCHRITVRLGRWIRETVTTAARLETCATEDNDHENGQAMQ